MERSSIFSFESLPRPTAVPKGMLLAIALLLIVEILCVRSGWVWEVDLRSQTGVMSCLEREVIQPAPDPEIVFLGDSRMRSAILPRLLEKEMDLDQGAVLNLALNGGLPFDSLTMYRRNRNKLGSASIVVVDFEAWFFRGHPSLTSRALRHATLKERVATYCGTDNLVPSLAGFAWQTYAAKQPINLLPRTYSDEFRRTVPPLGEDGRLEWNENWKTDLGPDEVDTNIYVDRFRYESLTNRHLGPLRELVALAQANGATVVVVNLPVRDDVVDAAEEKYHIKYDESWQNLRKLRDEFDHMIIIQRASEIDMPDNYFFDYGHMSRLGAEFITKKMAKELDSL